MKHAIIAMLLLLVSSSGASAYREYVPMRDRVAFERWVDHYWWRQQFGYVRHVPARYVRACRW